MKRLAALVMLLCLTAAPALAGAVLNEAGQSLQTDPVFVHESADPTLTRGEAADLREEVQSGQVDIYVAVLPEAARNEAGGMDNLPQALAESANRPGVFAAVSGKSFRAGASTGLGLQQGQVGRLATEAFDARHPARTGSIYPMLSNFVSRVQATAIRSDSVSEAVAPDTAAQDTEPEDSGFPVWATVLLVILGAVFLLFILGAWFGQADPPHTETYAPRRRRDDEVPSRPVSPSQVHRARVRTAHDDRPPRGQRRRYQGEDAYYHQGGTFGGQYYPPG